MKKRALSLFLVLALCLGLLPLPAAALNVSSSTTWTATTAGGKTINQSTYSDKIQVLVFFPVTRIEDDMGPAYAIDVQKLWAWEDLAAGGKVQVVAIGVPSGVDSDTTATARDLKNFMDKFRLTEKDGFTLAWMENNSIAFDYADEAGITLNRFCANYVVDSQRHIRAAWSGDFAPEQYSSALKELGITVNVPSDFGELVIPWTATTAGGQTIDQDTYSDKIQILVFFQVTRYEDGTYCLASQSTIQRLWAWEDLVASGKVQVVALGVPSGSRNSETGFSDITATAQDLRDFMDELGLAEKDGFTLAWVEDNYPLFFYERAVGIDMGGFCHNYVIDPQGNICAARWGAFYPAWYSDALQELDITAPWEVASGYCGAEGDGKNLSWALTGDGALTISGTGKMKDYLGPVMLFAPWFTSGVKVRTADIREGVTNIGEDAFYNCSDLTEVSIPASLTTIGWGAFDGCDALSSFTVAERNSAYAAVDGVLFNKDKSTLIQYPAGNGRTAYKVPDGVTTIVEGAFFDCQNLINVTLPDSLTTIEEYAFSSCYNLTSVTIPASVTTIGEGAFNACFDLTDITVAAENPVYAAEDGALFNKEKTTLIWYLSGNPRTVYAVPDGVTTIDDLAFIECSLADVTFPDSLTTIGAEAFEYCQALSGVTFPKNVTTIGDLAFQYCDAMTEVKFMGNAPTVRATDAYSMASNGIELLDVGYESGIFAGDTLTAYYPQGNSTWTEGTRAKLGENADVTWVPFDAGPSEPETYTVTVWSAQHGKVTASPAKAEAGTKVTLTVTPDKGYELDTLTVKQANGKTVAVAADNTFTMPASDVTVTPTFKELPPATYTVTVTTAQHGKVTADPTSGTAGTKVTLTVTPDSGYELDTLTVKQADGKTVTVAADNTFTMPASDVTVTATFKELPPPTYTVTVATAQHGKVTATPATGTAGTKVTLTVTPDEGYELDTLTVKQADGTEVEVTDNTFTMPASNVTATATFKELPPATYTVTVTTAQHGKVTASPTSGTAGTKVTLTVTPDKGYELDTLTVKQADGTAVEVTGNTFILPAADVTVTPTFKELPPETYTVTVTNAQHGKVTASPAKAEAGTKVTLTVTPDSGYELDTLTVKQSNGTAVKVTNNTFTMPASNVTVTATFKALPVDKLSLNKSSVSVSVGSSASVTATVSGYTGKHVYAISSDTSVVAASVSGKTVRVKGVAQGTATIYVAMTDAAAMTLEQVKADPSVKEIKVTVTKTGTNTGGGGGGSTGGGGGGGTGGGGGGASGGSSSGGSTGGNTGSTGSTTTPTAPATQTFTDVAKGSWYEPGVTFVVGKGLFNGVGANQFAPQQNMTRAMLMTVLARLAGQSTDGGATWYAKGMAWAKAQGVSDGTNPEGNITREQLVTMLYRYAKSPAAGAADMAKFVDANAVSDWAADAVRWAVQKGILTGKDGARLDPQGTATRAEVATILQRYVNL